MDSFLEGPWHWDWSGASRVWRREGLRSAAHSHLPCVLRWHWQIRYPERCSAGVSSEVRTEQCHTAVFPDFSPATSDQEKGIWSGFWRRWQHLVSSPSSSIQRWLSYGTKENREASIPLRKRRILSAPCLSRKSYAAALRGDDGGAAAAVSPVRREGRDGRDGLGPSCPEGDDSRMAMDAC